MNKEEKNKKKRLKSQFSSNQSGDSRWQKELVEPHIESFNWMVEKDGGQDLIVKNIPTYTIRSTEEFDIPEITYYISNVSISKPIIRDSSTGIERKQYPHICRETNTTYDSPLYITLEKRISDGPWETIIKECGRIPIMVKSNICNQNIQNNEELIEKKEDAYEWGGYFIINGNERQIRQLILNRRHYIFGITRSSFTKRGTEYTKYATMIRCVRDDTTSQTQTIHYQEDGTMTVRITIRRQEFFQPIIVLIKALVNSSDREIYENIVYNDEIDKETFITERVEQMLHEYHRQKQYTHNDVLKYLGKYFRLAQYSDPSLTDVQVGQQLLDEYIFIHVQDMIYNIYDNDINILKVNLLYQMIRKLFSQVQGKIKPDNIDTLSCHEVLLPGHLYTMLLKELLIEWQNTIKANILRDIRLGKNKLNSNIFNESNYWKRLLNILPDIGPKLRYFLVTGNLRSRSGQDQMQTSGYTIIAERLNYYRYQSHFRSIHRGQFFTTMKTTSIRKLLPESWGFLCPVHTPDGSPCGLQNHLTSSCKIQTSNCKISLSTLVHTQYEQGQQIYNQNFTSSNVPVYLNGIIVGKQLINNIKDFCMKLRILKIQKHISVYKYLEIYYIDTYDDGQYPSVYLFTTPCRFQRPVYNQYNNMNIIEYIGTQEQLILHIACTDDDIYKDITMHREIDILNIQSIVASQTPFSDHNQSPRNMYQCQMGKQTMGTPFHTLPYRTDNKIFRLQYSQSPLVRNEKPYTRYLLDEYPMGINAIVAVLSYTGYDMEDAVIINRSSYERGFGHGSVYKYKMIDQKKYHTKGEVIHHHFNNTITGTTNDNSNSNEEKKKFTNKLDYDGQPNVGQYIQPEEPQYAFYNDITKITKLEKLKDTEPVYIDTIRALGNIENNDKDNEQQQIGIMQRLNRNPVIGDKFSSRHGQKGVLSMQFPQVDMPWTESGIVPDIIINPHAFPSRMTMGMLIESMAGKVGSQDGEYQDSTPFIFNENNRAIDYFGKKQVRHGYNYLGNEPQYSGISGEPQMADIFIGCVYYQRLRHMVYDKFQARSTGPVNSIHRQPIKGRKVHGGIRFGEMERDSLIAHGISYFLNDRLMQCSDYHVTYICSNCGSQLSTQSIPYHTVLMNDKKDIKNATLKNIVSDEITLCRLCGTGSDVRTVAIPYVFQYLVNELAAMNIRLNLEVVGS